MSEILWPMYLAKFHALWGAHDCLTPRSHGRSYASKEHLALVDTTPVKTKYTRVVPAGADDRSHRLVEYSTSILSPPDYSFENCR